jgi:hypothetical protein
MKGAIPTLQYASMAWCSVKARLKLKHRGMKWWEGAGEDYIMWIFVTSTLHHVRGCIQKLPDSVFHWRVENTTLAEVDDGSRK